jgi:hypothetical protein
MVRIAGLLFMGSPGGPWSHNVSKVSKGTVKIPLLYTLYAANPQLAGVGHPQGGYVFLVYYKFALWATNSQLAIRPD